MEVKEELNQDIVTLKPVGDLDANSSVQVDEKIREWISKGQFRFLVDCSELEYISSAGLGLFISFLEEVRAGHGDFVFFGMTPKIQKVFELLGLDKIVKIRPDAAGATKEFQQ